MYVELTCKTEGNGDLVHYIALIDPNSLSTPNIRQLPPPA